jgi:hypothetical protein
MERERDRQLDRLAGQLREDGMPPERDLWPDIDAEISRREASGRRRQRAVPWWRLAAAAAAVIALGFGSRALLNVGEGTQPEQLAQAELTAPAAETAPGGLAGGMQTVDHALDELEAALAADPENRSLSRLVLMVHRTRGELLRRTTTTGLRAG